MRRPAFVGLVASLLLAGCAGHTSTMRDVRSAMRRGDLEEARSRLAEAGRGTDDLLFALEDGLLLFYAGEYELSNLRFEFADRRVDDLYTKSITRAALSMVTSDLVLRFEPRGIENFLVNYYSALSYLNLGREEEASVEWRRLAHKLQFSREQGAAAYLDPPFFNYLAGLGLEADDPNDAYISLRHAEAGYRRLGMESPPALIGDLVRLATRLGFADHVEVYRSRYGGDTIASGRGRDSGGRARGGEQGEVVILIEEGLVAPIEELRAYIPIVEDRAKRLHENGARARIDLARTLAQEYAAGRYHGVKKSHAGKRGIAYVIPLAFPVYGRGVPAFARLDARVGPEGTTGAAALNITALQGFAFGDRLLGIYAKTIARALVKYAAVAMIQDEMEEKHGEAAGDVAGILTNIVNVATERADTRAWLGLPHRIWMARVRVPPGRHDVQLVLDGDDLIALDPVEVQAGERSFVTVRIF